MTPLYYITLYIPTGTKYVTLQRLPQLYGEF